MINNKIVITYIYYLSNIFLK